MKKEATVEMTKTPWYEHAKKYLFEEWSGLNWFIM